jgi:2-keto-4-pentenoate hydratase/2-oxohepta-3-ene-1,7-dioic acid hydratase in catechol pathway
MKKKLVIGSRIGIKDKKSSIELLPGKIIAVGLNYRDHAKELSMKIPLNPIIFMKPNTSVIGHNDKIIYPAASKRVDYEAELALIIGKTAKDIGENDATKYIYGYTCANDVTARDLQALDVQ